MPKRTKPPTIPAPSEALERLASAGAAPGKLQQKFSRLLKKVEQLKDRLRLWQDEEPEIHRRLGALATCGAEEERLRHAMVVQLDRMAEDKTFGKRDRSRLAAAICQIAYDLLGDPDHAELKPIYNRHSGRDFDRDQEEADAAQARNIRGMMEHVFGMDFGDADVSSMDKLQAETEARLREEEAAEEARRAARPRKKTARQLARDAEREAERLQTGKVLQDVYRKLAVALHPDLERDPDERARKTELMQRVNVAYEAGDLLQLLELQLRFEQLDPSRGDSLPEDRLRRYNTLLDDQVHQLELQLEALEDPWRAELEMSPTSRINPALVVAVLRADAAELEDQLTEMRKDLEVFQHAAKLKAWLIAHVTPSRRRRSKEDELFDLMD